MPATFEQAANIGVGINEWRPYYHKPFFLGQAHPEDLGQSNAEYPGQDGVNYVWRDDSAGGVADSVCAWQDSDINCGYVYKVVFKTGLTDEFYIVKYNKVNGAETDNPSTTGAGRWITGSKVSTTGYNWRNNITGYITIDIGIRINVKSTTGYSDNQTFWIYTASQKTMDRRKIYHGGYATWLQYPAREGDVSRTPIIPISLKYKNITTIINHGDKTFETGGRNFVALVAAKTTEDIDPNGRMSIFFEHNIKPDSVANTASDTDFSFEGDDSNVLATIIASDIDVLTLMDSPVIGAISYEDSTMSTKKTGTLQTGNTTVTSLGGHARIIAQHLTDAVPGNDCQLAENQFFQIILTIN